MNAGLALAGVTALLWGSLPILLKNLLGALNALSLVGAVLVVSGSAMGALGAKRG